MSIDISSLEGSQKTLTTFHLDDFSYYYPEDLVAQSPASSRSKSRLLFRKQSGQIFDHIFNDLPELLSDTKPFILRNNSQVIHARLLGKSETGADVEIFLLEPTTPLNYDCQDWFAIGKPMKRLPQGKRIQFSEVFHGEIMAIPERNAHDLAPLQIRLTTTHSQPLSECIREHGRVPLPPYIKRDKREPHVEADTTRYQTTYARHLGSVAAPTAGLHFTKEMDQKLLEAGCHIAPCTLHVGAGTFLPVKDPMINGHRMHSERYMFDVETVENLIESYTNKRPILCVGTTSLRALESFVLYCEGDFGKMRSHAGAFLETTLFLRPKTRSERIKPSLTSMLLTNFHQPQSTLLMLICALLGYDSAMAMYRHAVEQRYRLFSYGDSSLLDLR